MEETSKLFIIRNDDNEEVIAIAEEKKLAKKFLKQNNISKYECYIEKITNQKLIDDYLIKYDDRIIVSVGIEDIVALANQYDQIYDVISQIKYNSIDCVNQLKYLSQLNITDEEEKVLKNAIKIIEKICKEDRMMYVLRDVIIYYLSKESAKTLKEIDYMKGKI